MALNPQTLLTAVPNVSDGSDLNGLAAVGEAFQMSQAAQLLTTPHSDVDHGRTVFTLAAEPGELSAALVDGAREALKRFDLSEHDGTHPSVGVVDVVPVVFLDEARRGAALAEALVTAECLASQLELPIFLYGAIAGGRTRAELRRGGLAEARYGQVGRRLAGAAGDEEEREGGEDDSGLDHAPNLSAACARSAPARRSSGRGP